MPFNKKDQLRKFIKSRIGIPIVDGCDSELSAVDEAVEMASVDYWISFPYVKKSYYNCHADGGELIIDMATELPLQILNANLRPEAYFIGITRYDTTNAVGALSYDNYLDIKLIGNDLGNYDGYPVQDPRYDSYRRMYGAQASADIVGTLEYDYDRMDNKLKIIPPLLEGQITLWFGWGFSSEVTVELVPMNHFPVFRKMVALQFLEIVIASRSTLTLQGDYQINLDDLEKKRDRLQEELDKEIPEMVMWVGQWG